jgi:hypothetical protein
LTSASDFGDDLFRGGFPYERLRVGVPVFGPLGDRRGEVGDTGEHATAEPFVVQFLEPALDQTIFNCFLVADDIRATRDSTFEN